jgi:hypothetical protein
VETEVKIIIDEITYNVKSELRFRFPKWKIVVLVAALSLAALGMAHADPTQWLQWGSGGSSGSMVGMKTS